MTTAPPNTPTKTARRPRWRWTKRVLLGLLGLVVLAYLTRGAHLHPWIVARAQRFVQERWGAELTVTEFESNWFTGARLAGVEFRAPAPLPELGGLESASLAELEVEFSLIDLLRVGMPGRLRGSGLVAAVDPRVIEFGAVPQDEPAGPAQPWPPSSARSWPALELSGIEVTVLLDDERAVLRQGAVSLARDDWAALPSILAGLTGQLELAVGPNALALAGLELEGSPRIEVLAALSDGQLTLETAEATWAGTALTLERGTASLAPIVLDLDFALQADDLEPLGAVLNDETWAGAIFGGVNVAGTWPDLVLNATLAGEAVLASSYPLGNVELGLELEVPGLDVNEATGALQLRAGPLFAGNSRLEELTASLQLGPDSIQIVEASIRQAGNLLRLDEVSLPRSVDPAVLLARSSGRFSAELSDLPGALGLPAPAGVPTHSLILAGELGDARARIDSGLLETPGGSMTINSGLLSLAGTDSVETELSATVEFTDLAPLGAILGDPTWTGEVHGDLQVAGQLPDAITDLQLSGSGVSIQGIPLGEFEVSGHLDRQAFRAESLWIRSGEDEISCSGGVVFEGPVFEDLELQGHVANAARYAPGFDLASGTAAIEIDLELTGPKENLAGRIDLVMQGWTAVGLAFTDIEVHARAGEGLYQIEHLAAALPEGLLEFAGSIDPPFEPDASSWAIELRSGSFTGEEATFALTRAATLVLADDGSVRAVDVQLAGTPGTVTASFTREAAGATAEVALDLAPGQLLLDRYLPQGPRWERVAGTLNLSPTGLALEGLSLEAPLWRFGLSGTAPLDPLGVDIFPAGPLELTATFAHDDLTELLGWEEDETEEQVSPFTGAVASSLTLGGTWRELEGQLDLGTTDLVLTAAQQEATFAARALLADDVLRLERTALEAPGRMLLGLEGTVSLPTDPHGWLADAQAEFARGELDLVGEINLSDLSWLALMVPDFRRTAGAAHGRLALSGPLAAPRFEGEATLEGGELKLTSDIPAMSAMELKLEFEERTIRIARAQGELGGSPFSAQGEIELASEERAASLDLEIVGENLLIHRDRDLLLRADADLTITGEVEDLLLAGRLALRQPRYTKDIELLNFTDGKTAPAPAERGIHLFSFSQPPVSEMRLDLRIETVEPVLLRNNLVRGSLRPDLHLGGTGRIPRLLGTIYLDPTQIRLPASSVMINSGTITFRASDPFIPELEIFGSAVKFGHQVTVLATGPYDAPELTLTSSPPLPKEDLLMILLTGQYPDQAASFDGSRAATQTVALYLAEDMISGWLGEGSIEDDQESVFDSVEILIGREVTNSGLPTTEVFLNVADNVASERDHLKLAMELDKWDSYNLGLRFVLILR